jgi:hypothetical protein
MFHLSKIFASKCFKFVKNFPAPKKLKATPENKCYKTFLSVIYSFSYYARVFGRIGSKSLPRTYTTLLQKLGNYQQKNLITFAPEPNDIKLLISVIY